MKKYYWILSLILVLTLLTGSIGAVAFAEEPDEIEIKDEPLRGGSYIDESERYTPMCKSSG